MQIGSGFDVAAASVASEEPAVNSMQIIYDAGEEGSLGQSGIGAAFFKMQGQEEMKVRLSANSIAAVAPRRVIFAVDISGSMVADTHNTSFDSGESRRVGPYAVELSTDREGDPRSENCD